MANATGEWISAMDVSMPLMILTYEDHMDEVGFEIAAIAGVIFNV